MIKHHAPSRHRCARAVALGWAAVLAAGSAMAASQPIAVEMSVANVGGAMPRLAGTTNLPDGFEFMITTYFGQGAMLGQDTVTVHGGRFESGQFSDNGAPYNSGPMSIEVTSAMAVLEPPGVVAAIGEHGEWMRGPFVIDQGEPIGRTIDFKKAFEIP